MNDRNPSWHALTVRAGRRHPVCRLQKRCAVRIFLLLWMVTAAYLPPVAAQEQPPARVVVLEAGREVVAANRPYIGLLAYDRTSQISTEVAGLVDRVFVREGDRVKAGDPLVSLDTELLDTEIDLYRTRIEQVRLRLELAAKNLGRLEILLARKGTSEKNYDDALHAHQDAEAEKKAAELELEKLLIRRKKSVIRAPYDGVVLRKNADTGDWVQQGTNLATVGSGSDLVVRVPVEESNLRFAAIGEEVPLTITAFGRELTGTILRFDPVADVRTKNVSVVVGIPPQDLVAENMSATVFIPVSEKRELTVVPRDALVSMQGEDFVYTVRDGRAAILPVRVVTYLGGSIGTDSPGLDPGTPVVVEGNERLRPDQPVTVAGDS